MEKLSPEPRVKLSRLREIGWTLWDPIGLLSENSRTRGTWAEDCANFADEYDRYLVAAASRLRRGEPREKIVGYLIQIETDAMGLSANPTTRERAEAVVDAILADDTLWTWPDEQGRFS